MTIASGETTTQSTRSGNHGLGAIPCSIFGTISAGIALLCLGITALVWSDAQLWAWSSWGDEAGLGIAAGLFFLIVWAVLMLIAIILAVVGARGAEGHM